MGWRDQYKVHPVADVFPMISDAELDELGKDIKANGLRVPIAFQYNGANADLVVDGRNRLEAMKRAGVELRAEHKRFLNADADAVAYVISANIHRRHLTKQERADLIVAALKAGKPRQDGEVSKCIKRGCTNPCDADSDLFCSKHRSHLEEEIRRGGRGKKNPIKEKAVEIATENGISKRTVERAIAKAEGGQPKPKSVIGTCDYDPDDDIEGEPIEVTRRRGNLFRLNESLGNAEFIAQYYRDHPSEADEEIRRMTAAVLAAAWAAAHKIEREKFLQHVLAEEIGPAVETAREYYATQLSDLNAGKIAAEIELLKASVGELKGITAPSKKACPKCHDAGTVIGKTGIEFACSCVKREVRH